MRVLFSLSYNPTFEVPQGAIKLDGQADTGTPPTTGSAHVSREDRPSDWGLRGARKKLFHVKSALQVARRAAAFDAVALCTVGIEAFFVGRFKAALCPRTRIVLADFLVTRPSRFDATWGSWLRCLDEIAVIRSGDQDTLEARFGFERERTRMVLFPAASLPQASEEGDYLYAAGVAHRDWPTLISALEGTQHRAILSPGAPISLPSSLAGRVEVRPALPPEQGRALMAGARAVAMPFRKTSLPSGPLVLLDAMAYGKAIAVTHVNGSRDYARDGHNALVVPPGDPSALREAIDRLMTDSTLRQNLAARARHDAQNRFTNQNFIGALLRACAALPADTAIPEPA